MPTSHPANPTRSTARPDASRLAWLVPAGIFVGALLLRLAGIGKSLWIDEASTIRHMRMADLIASLRSDIHPPLYFFLLKAATHLTSSFTSLRLLSVGCGVGAVAVFCFFFRGRERSAGWIAGLLLATLPGFMANSQELRQYALLSLSVALALFFAWRFLQAPRKTGALVRLAGALAAAAATHLITVFFLAALGTTLGWRLRHEWRAVFPRIAIALAPAAGLIGFFKLVFLLPQLQAGQWWMPAINGPVLMDVFGEASGGHSFQWVAAACERNFNHTGVVVMGVLTVSTVFVCWTAWGRRQAGGAHLFLAIAAIYWALMIGYSVFALPVLWPRTVLPGMLPLILGLGLGIATHPDARHRAAAMIAIAVLAFAFTVPWLRIFAFRPNEDLRGFDQTLQSTARPDSLLILIGEVEIGIEPYWPEYHQARLVRLNLTDPKALADLAAALGRERPVDQVLLIYRADFYLAGQRPALDAVVTRISTAMSPSKTVWDKDGYVILQFAPAH